MDKPLVSVRLMVYNNEPYIREAVESILMQETNFKVEIVVGDDFSTDSTLDIIKSYNNTKNIYFNILNRPVGGKYWKDRQRFGRLHNFKSIMDNCSGKYIALLDGDDYWTDPLKLQKQVDFLENNLDYGICFHRVNIFEDKANELIEDVITRDVKEITDINELANGNYIHTPSVMLRNNFDIPDWFNKSPIGDWVLYMICIGNNKIKKMKEIMAVYRVNEKGIWSLTPIKNRLSKTVKSIELVLEKVTLTQDVSKALDKLNQEYKRQIIEIETKKQSFWKRFFN